MPTADVLRRPLTLPVVAAPMFIASNPRLVIAQSTAGVIGSFPALNARPATMLHDWLEEIEEGLAISPSERPAAPFAINQIVHRSNDRLEHDMEVISAHRVPVVITSLGVQPEINDAVHAYGGIVLHDVISDRHARKAIESGADGIIAVAAGAGGHAGAQSPFALVREIREWFSGPLLLSGAIAHGASIFAALAAGADFAYIGSAFLSTPEANVSPEYRKMLLQSTAKDIVYSNLFTGVHGNYLRGSIERAGMDPDNLPVGDPSMMSFASAGSNAAKAWRDIWGAGQGIGAIARSQPTKVLIERLASEFDVARDRALNAVRVGM